MPHVTFIHGILNKPPQDDLLNIWNQALAFNEGIDLGANGITSSMVYWADVMYDKPDLASVHESADGLPDGAATDVEFSWMEGTGKLERDFINGLAAKIDRNMPPAPSTQAPSVAEMVTVTAGVVLERLPVPWSIKRKVMEALLRDVHHYLFNATTEPRLGDRYKVQETIRERFVKDLVSNAPKKGPHIVVSHSMGTVVAYDCLKRVKDCPPIDALMTLGSPLGIDEVRDLLQPGWTPQTPPVAGWSPVDAFPSEKVRGAWVNVYDWLDPVDGTEPVLNELYMKTGAPVVEDISVANPGWWRHDLSKYVTQQALRTRLASLLDI